MKSQPSELTWKNINLTTQPGKKILKNICGQAEPGTITAIMGPSGCGKSTLLNTLTGRIPNDMTLEGEILLNGNERNSEEWPRIISYVNQYLFAYEKQSVYETLQFAAKAKLGDKGISKKIEEIIEKLGLFSSKDTFVDRLSGGEKMRLSIGIELIGDPNIIFLDEPTSGLDSFNAINILNILQDLAKNGKTIIMTIHQPSYKMLQSIDKIMLLSQSGCVFEGDVEACIKFFSDCGFDLPSNTNPSDFFIDVVSYDSRTPESRESSLETIKSIKKEWNFIKETKEPTIFNPVKPNRLPKRSAFFFNLINREFIDTMRNKQYIKAKIFQKIIIMIMFGFTYFQLGIENADIYSLRGILTFLVLNEIFGVAGPIFNQFSQTKKIIERERMSGYYSGYEAFLSKSLCTICTTLMFEIPYIIVVYFLIGMNSNFLRFVLFLIIICFLVVFSISFALTISVLTKRSEAAQILGVTFCIIFILYSGAFNNPSTIPAVLRWLIWLSPANYAFRAALQDQLNGKTINGIPGEQLISDFGLGGVNILTCLSVLLGFSIVLQLAGSFVLHKKTQSNFHISKSDNINILIEKNDK